MRRLVLGLACAASCSDHEAAARYAAAYCAEYCARGELTPRCRACGPSDGGAAGGAAAGGGSAGGGSAGGSAGGASDGGFTLEAELLNHESVFAGECVPLRLAAPGASQLVTVTTQSPVSIHFDDTCDAGTAVLSPQVSATGTTLFLRTTTVGLIGVRFEAMAAGGPFVDLSFPSYGQVQPTVVNDGGSCIDVLLLRATEPLSDGRNELTRFEPGADVVSLDDGGILPFTGLGCDGGNEPSASVGYGFSFRGVGNLSVAIAGPYLKAALVHTSPLYVATPGPTGASCGQPSVCHSKVCAGSTSRCLCTPAGGTCTDGPSQCCDGQPCDQGTCR